MDTQKHFADLQVSSSSRFLAVANWKHCSLFSQNERMARKTVIAVILQKQRVQTRRPAGIVLEKAESKTIHSVSKPH